MDSKAKIKAALKATTISRAGKPDQLTLTVYSNRLVHENEADVLAALEKLAERKREDYETALPEIGVMLALVEIERIARQNRSESIKSSRLVRWECPSCHATQCGFPAINDSLDRRCYKKFYSEAQQQTLECGTQMIVTFDEAAEDTGQRVKFEAPAWMNEVRQ